MTSSWQETRANALAAMTAEDRVVYDEAYEQAGIAMHLAEMVYQARTAAGLSQTELARRMGTRQPAIAAIENGARTPTVELLDRLARALGSTLHISIDPAA
jgi:ribosome-binding protein aMBF1 (putative translation factor)